MALLVLHCYMTNSLCEGFRDFEHLEVCLNNSVLHKDHLGTNFFLALSEWTPNCSLWSHLHAISDHSELFLERIGPDLQGFSA